MGITVVTGEIPQINIRRQVEHGSVDNRAQVGHDTDTIHRRVLGRRSIYGIGKNHAYLPWRKPVPGSRLYQALYRLERRGWVEAEWGISDTGRRARFYELTPAGRKRLKSDVAELRRYVAALFAVLETA